jgi:phospholipase D1/2
MWRDVFDAMCDAKQFIYAVGWSFDTDQYLLRGDELTKELAQGKYSPRLGELLLDKAEEGVVVNLMQWDDFSSNALQQTGKMGTYDEHTRNFFKGTKVNARFMSMAGGETNTILEGLNKTMAFTHHQKFIIMDAPKSNGNGRELLAFVGGIDLTEGRWDNRQVRRMIYSRLVVAGCPLISDLCLRCLLVAQHPLFRTLQSLHSGDQYKKCFNTNPAHGPRQPWHDIHSSVRGPEAIHLVRAFEERWKKQAEPKLLVSLSQLGLDKEISLENKGGWCAQLSRSIDSRTNDFLQVAESASTEFVNDQQVLWTTKGHPQDKICQLYKMFQTATMNRVTTSRYLDTKKGRLVDTSIHTTNIHQIRRAKHFIYIESQYFMGSSFMWGDHRHVKCGNLIAAEVRTMNFSVLSS